MRGVKLQFYVDDWLILSCCRPWRCALLLPLLVGVANISSWSHLALSRQIAFEVNSNLICHF